MQEIEDHFSGKKKIPKSLKRKDPVSEIAFPPFDVNKWESNEKFEKHLQQHKYGHVVLAANTQNNSNGLQKKNISNQKKSEVSDEDYDTPL